nr:hypothetical protein Iba_chr10aCG17290 [Ipomoea batatas]
MLPSLLHHFHLKALLKQVAIGEVEKAITHLWELPNCMNRDNRYQARCKALRSNYREEGNQKRPNTNKKKN